MSEDFSEFFTGETVTKDQKTSIRNKYKRRLRNLASTLDDFIHHAELRLDAQRAGRIHKRSETEQLLEHCKALRAAIPIIDEEELDEQVYRNLCDVFGIDPDLPDDEAI
jgi:hypothetical protein